MNLVYILHIYIWFTYCAVATYIVLLSITHVHIQETQRHINALLETADEDVLLSSSSESEDEGMCRNNYILYVCT